MSASRITANLPAPLELPVRHTVRQEFYPCESDYGLGVLLWDIYSRQPHTLTGPLMHLPRWKVESVSFELAKGLGLCDPDSRSKVPYRFTVSVPEVLRPAMLVRKKEERYKSLSAYVTGLVFFELKVRTPDPKKVPHHKIVPLLRQPVWIRDAVFTRLAEDFGNPARKWPKDLGGRIEQLISEQEKVGAK